MKSRTGTFEKIANRSYEDQLRQLYYPELQPAKKDPNLVIPSIGAGVGLTGGAIGGYYSGSKPYMERANKLKNAVQAQIDKKPFGSFLQGRLKANLRKADDIANLGVRKGLIKGVKGGLLGTALGLGAGAFFL